MSTSRDTVSDQLSLLKERSGRSYEWLARRTHLSKSSVQRYCTGAGTPPTFGVIETIALACGADADEIAVLFRRWEQALTASDTTSDTTADATAGATSEAASGTSPAAVAVLAAPVTVPAPAARPADPGKAPAARPPRWRRHHTLLAGLAVVAVAVTTAVVLTRPDGGGPPTASAQPSPSGSSAPGTAGGGGSTGVLGRVPDSWTNGQADVQPTFFGVTLNAHSGNLPTFRVGAVRLWDSGTRWTQLQPEPGRYDWTTLDRHVTSARAAGLPVLFTFGGTPRWAAPDAPAAAYPDGTRAAPPTDLTLWDELVRQVTTRYPGRISAYELWPLGNDHRYFDAGPATLVDMTRRAARIIRAADPRATILCPGMGNLWTEEGRSLMRRFAEVGGYDHCDVASIKLYQREATDPPESMLELMAGVQEVLHSSGVQPRIWVTGTTYGIVQQKPVPPGLTRAYATRYYLAGLYSTPNNVERMYFYNWGSSRLPLPLQAEGSPPTPAALAVDRLQSWVAGARLLGCGHGPGATLPEHVWQCRFVLPGTGDRPQTGASVRWTDSGTVTVPARSQDAAYRDLDGLRVPLSTGAPIPLGAEPVLVEELL